MLVDSPEGEQRAELVFRDGAKVGDLLAALSCPGRPGLCVDGEWFEESAQLSALPLFEGSRVAVASPPDCAPPPSARVLAVVGGLRAGVRLPLPDGGAIRIGRGPENDLVIKDPSVSAAHLVMWAAETPLVHDLGSRNGSKIGPRSIGAPTPVDENVLLALGASRVTWRREPVDQPMAFQLRFGPLSSTISFNRPPRAAPVLEPAALKVPGDPGAPVPTEPLSWAGIVLPVVAGAVVAVVWSPYLAAFAALGPALTIGTWLERRRRVSREHRHAKRRLDDRLRHLHAQLPSARDAEIDRLRDLHPDPAEIVRRALGPSTRCWERRPGDGDFMQLAVGLGSVDLAPGVEVEGTDEPAPAAIEMLAVGMFARDVPIVVDMRPGRLLGLVGPVELTRPIARALLLQAGVHHGPADLAVVVLAGGGRDGEPCLSWEWTRWLPHTTDPVGARPGLLVATSPSQVPAVVQAAETDGSERCRLVVFDSPEVSLGRTDPRRRMLDRDDVSGLVLAEELQLLPSVCTDVIEVVHPAGLVRLVDPRSTAATEDVIAWGLEVHTAQGAALGLARMDDPEQPAIGSGLVSTVDLVDLVVGGSGREATRRRWARNERTADLRVPIGSTADGPMILDLVADGPHVLVGGTTGSGKSELLRTIVSAIALEYDPDHVAFVLVDYKGGAAFDACADLPHVAGMVTDLDDRLAARALRCLEAELRHREERLRAVGAEDLTAFRSVADTRAEPLPRLVVVVDEFASMVTELPEFVGSLVGIAQRGRSLGIHLILATQRPAGVVTEDIRANTGCRIALRVTDRRDSLDVIDVADAAMIPRNRPGRALARFGPGDVVSFQVASVSRDSTDPAALASLRPADERTPTAPTEIVTDGPTTLSQIVDAARHAQRDRGGRPPRAPWPDPLPGDISMVELRARVAGGPACWLADDPDRQLQSVGGWHPAGGHLLVIGGPASGKTTALASIALDLACRIGPDDLHIHVIDLEQGDLSGLAPLPHVGSSVGPAEHERRARLLRWLADEVVERRADPTSPRPCVVVLVDGWAGLSRAHDPVRESDLHDRLTMAWADGPGVGVVFAASIGRAGDLRSDLAASVGTALVLRLSDPVDPLRFGIRSDTSENPPGRAVLRNGNDIQVARPWPDVRRTADHVAGRWSPPSRAPVAVRVLESVIAAADIPVSADTAPGHVGLVFARESDHLEAVGFELRRGEHALVAGPPRSGRTNALAVMGAALGSHAVVVGSDESDLAAGTDLRVVSPEGLAEIIERSDVRVLLVDDADRVADPTGVLGRLTEVRGGPFSIIAASTVDRIRSGFGHWTSGFRASRAGVLLRPGPIDGDLFGVSTPRLDWPKLPGRGLLVVDGCCSVVQIARASDRL